MDYKNFGLLIMLYRRENRISQVDFAARADISRNYLSLIERNKADNLSVDVLVKLARSVGMDACELLKVLLGGDYSSSVEAYAEAHKRKGETK